MFRILEIGTESQLATARAKEVTTNDYLYILKYNNAFLLVDNGVAHYMTSIITCAQAEYDALVTAGTVNNELMYMVSFQDEGVTKFSIYFGGTRIDTHKHENKDVLDLLTIDEDGKLNYNGVPVDDTTDNHAHTNKDVIDNFSVGEDGKLLYNGSLIEGSGGGTGGGTTVIGEALDYGYFVKSVAQAAVADTIITFGSTYKSKNITIDANGNVALKAGKTYRIKCNLFADTASGFFWYHIYENLNNSQIGGGIYVGANAAMPENSHNIDCLYTPPTDRSVYVKVSSTGNASIMIRPTQISYLIIEEIGYTAIVDPMNVKDNYAITYGRFGLAAYTTQTTDLTTGSLVKFASGGGPGISVNTDTFRVGLKGKKTYRISYKLHMTFANATSYCSTRLKNMTTNAYMGNTTMFWPLSSTNNVVMTSGDETYYTPSDDCDIALELVSVTGTITAINLATLMIDELAQSVVVEYNNNNVEFVDPIEVKNAYSIEYASMSTVGNQALALNTTGSTAVKVTFDRILNSYGLTADATNSTISLKKGKTYRILATLMLASSSRVNYFVADATNLVSIAGVNGLTISSNYNEQYSDAPIDFIYKPSYDMTICVAINFVMAAASLLGSFCKFMVQEIAQPVVLKANYPNVIDPFDAQDSHQIEYGYFYNPSVANIITDTMIYFTTTINAKSIVLNANGTIRLHAGKTYRIMHDYRVTTASGSLGLGIYNVTKNDWLGGYGVTQASPNYATSYSGYGYNGAIVSVDTDCDICLKCSYASTTMTIGTLTIVIEEIAQPTVVEYTKEIANPLTTTDRAEENPIGSIVNYAGSVAPKNYLLCDGKEYNIADYPELADHIFSVYGKYNYWGGNGTTTFAVPTKGRNMKNIIPLMTSNTTPSGVASASSSLNADYYPYCGFNENAFGGRGWASSTLPATLEYDFGVGTTVSYYSVKIRTADYNDLLFSPKNWTFEGWNGSVWTVLDTRTNIVWNTSGEEKTFGTNSSLRSTYTKYRINVSAVNGSTFVLMFLKMYGTGREDSYCIKAKKTYTSVNQYGGFESKVLWEGLQSTNSTITLLDSIQNYDAIIVSGGYYNSSNLAHTQITSIIITKDNYYPKNLSEVQSAFALTETIITETRRIIFAFASDNTISLSTNMMALTKVIGLKGQIPTLLTGGTF